jgi:hypothetical protein
MDHESEESEMSAKLQATKNYDLFELLQFNRDVGKTKRLEKSMCEHGYLPAYPMHVVRNGNGKLMIKAGHHRLHVAKKLGVPVFYVICEDIATVHELESATNSWKLNDYLMSFVRSGAKQYEAVKAFSESTGISLSQCISLLAGESATSFNHANAFKIGTYKISDCNYAKSVGDIIIDLRKLGIAIATNRYFVSAISRMVRIPQFSPSQFIRRVSVNLSMMQKRPTADAYADLIEQVYNHASRDKVPLAFLASQAAAERLPKGLRK